MAHAVTTIRKSKGLTIAALGKAVGCSRQCIYHIERAENFPTLAVYLKLCRVLNQAKPPLT